MACGPGVGTAKVIFAGAKIEPLRGRRRRAAGGWGVVGLL